MSSLILVSKFTQDKCYSNRACEKLSGLSPRNIGHCERALGDALNWRRLVGKTPSSALTPSPTALASARTSHSDGDLLASKPALANEWRTASTRTRNVLLRSKYSPPPHLSQPWTHPPMPRRIHTCIVRGMSTLTLTHSSTESSSGDCTIHMAGFIDDLAANECFDLILKHPLSLMYCSAPPHAPANPHSSVQRLTASRRMLPRCHPNSDDTSLRNSLCHYTLASCDTLYLCFPVCLCVCVFVSLCMMSSVCIYMHIRFQC